MHPDMTPPPIDERAGVTDTTAIAFNARLRRLTTPAACATLFREAIAPFGFDTFACGELDLSERARNVFYIIDWPDSWARFYAQSGMINRDPVVEELARRRQPFSWSDLRADRKLAKAGRQALDLAAAEGWIEGFVVPLPSAGQRVGLVSMAGHRLVAAGAHDYLGLIGQCLHAHVRTLLPREGFAAPPAGLSGREIECLRLVARGVSDRAIGAELGIAVSTAHEFVEKAKHKLNVKSRAELVAIAVALGVIDI
jgi:LuxR family quorum sensing-dependent transcriptional regulator